MPGTSFTKPGAAMFNLTSTLWTHTAELQEKGRFSWVWVVAILLTILALGAVAWLVATGRLPFGLG